MNCWCHVWSRALLNFIPLGQGFDDIVNEIKRLNVSADVSVLEITVL